MKMKKWKALLATMTAALAFSTVGALFSSVEANAAVQFEQEVVTVNDKTVPTQTLGEYSVRFGMDTGAEIRISTEATGQGLRFSSYVATADYEEIIAAGGSFGTLIMPKDTLNGEELTHNVGTAGEDYLDIEANNVNKNADTSLTRFNGVITKLKTENYGREFCARAYAELNGEYVYSQFIEADHSRSAKNVALDGVANGDVTDKNRAQLEAYMDAKESAVQMVETDCGICFGYLVAEGRSHLPVPQKEYNVFNGWYDVEGTLVTEIAANTIVENLTARWVSVMGEKVLDNFDDKVSSLKRYSVGTETESDKVGNRVSWLPSYETNGETRNGVLKVILKTGEYFWANFTRTAEELKELGITQITIKLAIENGTETADTMLRWSASSGDTYKAFGVGTVKGNVIPWQEVTIDVATLSAYGRFATAGVWDTLGNGGAGNWFIRCATDANLYIDEITCTALGKEEPMPKGTLDNYTHEASVSRLRVATEAGVATSGDQPTWLESYTTNNETRTGVAKVVLKTGNYLWLNLTRTPEELKALGIESITIKAAIANETGTADNMLRWSASSGDTYKAFGVGTVTGNVIPWQEITIDVATLSAYGRFATAGVWDTLGKGGAGNWFIRAAAGATVYIDEITYTAPPREAEMPEGVLENFSSEYHSLQRYCVGTGAYLVAPSLAGQTKWLATHTVGEETKNGVLHVTLNSGQYLTAQFTKTAVELEALGVTTITFKMAWTATSTTPGNSLRFSDDKETTGDTGTYAGSNKLNSGAWETVTITLAELNAFKRFDGNAWSSLGSDGAKNWLIRCAYASTTVELYIDSITYN